MYVCEHVFVILVKFLLYEGIMISLPSLKCYNISFYQAAIENWVGLILYRIPPGKILFIFSQRCVSLSNMYI